MVDDNNKNDQDKELEALIKKKLADEQEGTSDDKGELLTQYSLDEDGELEHSDSHDDEQYYDEGEHGHEHGHEHGEEHQGDKSKLNIIGPILAGTFMLFVFVLVYMKYSNNCGLLGSSVESMVGEYLCKGNESLLSEDSSQGTTSGQVVRKDVKDPFTQNVEAAASDSVADISEDAVVPEQPTSNGQDGNGQDGGGIDLGSNDSTRGSEPGLDRAQAGLSGDGSQENMPPPKPIYETPALLVAENRQKITNRLPARVKLLGYRDGQDFKEGDILATLDCKEIEIDLAIQKEVFKEKSASLENLKKLKELKSTSEYSVVKAEAEFGQSEKIIEKYENQLKDCVIKAEYDGKVISTAVTEREFLFAGKEIMTINNNKDLLVKAYVPIVWLEWMNVGTGFKLCINMDCYQGVVTRIGAEVDAISQTLDVFGKLSVVDNTNLIAGLSGQINFDKQD